MHVSYCHIRAVSLCCNLIQFYHNPLWWWYVLISEWGVGLKSRSKPNLGKFEYRNKPWNIGKTETKLPFMIAVVVEFESL